MTARSSFPAEMPGNGLAADSARIFGAGEMASLTRALDWSGTPLGPIESWPPSLAALVNTLLSARHPMLLMWGEGLVQFYNDAFRPSIRDDKHPAALGQKASDCWAEIWHIIGPQLESVLRGESIWMEDTLVPINRDGQLVDVYWTYGYSPARDEEGNVRGVLVVCSDTTASVVGRRQLEHERQRLDDLFEQAPAFFAVLDGPDFVFEMVNSLYQDLLGPRVLLGRTVRDAVPEAVHQGFVGVLEEVYRTGQPYIGHNVPIELARHGSDARELRYLNFVYQPRRDSSGNITGIIVFGVDVTEMRRAQELLIRSEKLVAVGRLASSIAHEINNPLEAITNLLYLAQKANQDSQVRDFLSAAEIELRRVSAIASQTLRFHRQSTLPHRVSPAQMVDETLLLYQGKLSNCQTAVNRRDRATRAITCLEGEIRQALSNLVGNAIDAMPPGGRIVIRTRDACHRPTGRKGVVFTIADNGSGMSPDTMGRIFEAFFTTKGAGGTGLGLWVTREIVDRHQGILQVRSRQAAPNYGTIFRLFLPEESELSQ